MMNTLTILIATLALVACRSTTASPAPASGAANLEQATHYDFSDLPDRELGLAQFLKECEARTVFNFTYGPTAAAVIDKSFVRFSRTELMTPAEFEAALQQVLRTRGLEAERIGPDHLRVFHVRVRSD